MGTKGRFGCEGCPAKGFFLHLNRNQDLDPTESGAILFMTVMRETQRLLSEVGDTQSVIDGLGAWAPDEQDTEPIAEEDGISRKDIAIMAMACAYRDNKGKCLPG